MCAQMRVVIDEDNGPDRTLPRGGRVMHVMNAGDRGPRKSGGGHMFKRESPFTNHTPGTQIPDLSFGMTFPSQGCTPYRADKTPIPRGESNTIRRDTSLARKQQTRKRNIHGWVMNHAQILGEKRQAGRGRQSSTKTGLIGSKNDT